MSAAAVPLKQAIAGVSPATARETTVMVVWPSIAALGIGRLLGSLFSIRLGAYIFRVGNFIALAASPLCALLYLGKVAPFAATRYRLTNRRIIVERGITGSESRSVELDRFDNVEIDVKAGQAWFDAGDLIFRQGDTETFRLEGVGRPEAFRQTCLKSRHAYVGVKEALG
jgi:hypothetical protein